jgi:hypothetical protein
MMFARVLMLFSEAGITGIVCDTLRSRLAPYSHVF